MDVIQRSWYVINPKKGAYKPYGLMAYRLQNKRITYAYRRYHTNPSDWIKVKHFLRSALFFGTPDWIRTSDLQSRSLTLYPTELRAHILPRKAGH